jgi:muramoyltetrapeptide carboxypeptidase
VAAAAAAPPAPAGRLPVVKPPRLRRGGTIGLVCPAGALDSPRTLNEARDDLEALGFRTRPGRHCLARHGYLAGTDEQRAEDVMEMFESDDIDAVIAIRGGWGASRILPLLDYEVIRANPKPLVGYSDITSLLLAVYARSGLVTFHGPVGRSTWNRFTADAFERVLVRAERLVLDPTTTMGPDGERRVRSRMSPRMIYDGRAEGPLAGGNLSIVASMAGTPYLPDFRDHVMFFEDVNEPLYRVDRLVTQLKQAGLFAGTAGLVFGQCSSCPGEAGVGVEELLAEHLRPLRRPAWSGAPIGHVSPVYTLPIGVRAATDSALGSLALLEPAVS